MNTRSKLLELLRPKKIIGYGITAICFLLCAYILTEYICSTTEGRPPRLFTYSISYVPTESMEPTISAKEYVIFQSTNFDSISAGDPNNQFDGDIVIYKNSDGIYVIHRVIAKYDDYMIVQGDNNPIPDSDHVTRENLYGKYLGKVDFLSNLFKGGISKSAIFVLLIVIFVLVIGVQIVSIIVKAKSDEFKNKKKLDNDKLIEEARKQILAEELEKLKNEEKNKNE